MKAQQSASPYSRLQAAVKPALPQTEHRTARCATASLPALGSFFALAGFCSTDSSAEAVCRDVSDSAPTQSSRAQLPAQGLHRSRVLIKVHHAADAPVLLTTHCNFSCWWTTQRSGEQDVSLSSTRAATTMRKQALFRANQSCT